jgi:branched-chain amino acid transport system permease protein
MAGKMYAFMDSKNADDGKRLTDMAAQILANALITAASACLVSVGFGIIYSTVRFFHFAHGAVITIAVYVLYWFLVFAKFPWQLALVIGLISSVLAGLAMELAVYRHLRQRRASPAVLLIASLGLLLAVQNTISLVFGDVPVVIPLFRSGYVFEIVGARITKLQASAIVLSAFVTCGTAIWWSRSKIGMILRAVGQDSDLATVCGVSLNQAAAIAISFGSVLGGLGAIFLALDTSISPVIGFQLLFVSVVAVLITRKGGLAGIIIASVLIGIIQHLVGWKLSTQWQGSIVFLILIILLLLRPNGLVGKQTTT